jgi:hypothetical protein
MEANLSNACLQMNDESQTHRTGFGDPAVPKSVLDTPDDEGGSVQLTEITVRAGNGNRGAVLLRWRVGPASGLWDVHLNISSNVHIGVHVTGHGGGVFSNVWIWGADHSQWSGQPMSQDAADIGFLGESAGPLWAVGVAAEHNRLAAFALRNAHNYQVKLPPQLVVVTSETLWAL